MKNHLQQHEVYEGSSYLQPCDNSRTIPLCERQSFPPRLLQQLMPREKRQTGKRGRQEEREEVGERVRRLHLHSNGQTERFFIFVIISSQTFPVFMSSDKNKHTFFSEPGNVSLFLNASCSSPRDDKLPLLFCCSFCSEYILITREGRKHCYLHSPELFLNP